MVSGLSAAAWHCTRTGFNSFYSDSDVLQFSVLAWLEDITKIESS